MTLCMRGKGGSTMKGERPRDEKDRDDEERRACGEKERERTEGRKKSRRNRDEDDRNVKEAADSCGKTREEVRERTLIVSTRKKAKQSNANVCISPFLTRSNEQCKHLHFSKEVHRGRQCLKTHMRNANICISLPSL